MVPSRVSPGKHVVPSHLWLAWFSQAEGPCSHVLELDLVEDILGMWKEFTHPELFYLSLSGGDFLALLLDNLNTFHSRVAQPTQVGCGSSANMFADKLDMTMPPGALLLQKFRQSGMVRED